MTIRLSLVALAAASVLAVPAFGASSSSASIGPLTVGLFDLDPFDNVEPSITFNGLGYNFASAFAFQANLDTSYQDSYSVGSWTPNAAGASVGVAQANAEISGPADANGTTVSAWGSAADFGSANGGDYAQYGAEAYAPISDNSFTLSANTVVVISGAANVAADGSGIYSYVYTDVGAWMSIEGPGGGGDGWQSAYDSIGFTSIFDGEPFSLGDSRILGVSLVNLTGDDMIGNLSVSAYAYGETYANPVPEPETWPLMLVGFGIVMAALRRRPATEDRSAQPHDRRAFGHRGLEACAHAR